MVKIFKSLLLAILLAIFSYLSIVFIWESHAKQPTLQENKPATSSPASSLAMSDSTPQVNSQRLLKFLSDINYERYHPQQRQRVRNYLKQKLRDFGWSPQQQVFDKPDRQAQDKGVNIWAQQPGSHPEAEKIIVAAHYDTVAGSPGADDNGSGVATVLEVARLFGQRQTDVFRGRHRGTAPTVVDSTRRSLQVVFFDAEEQGMLGSLAFTDVAAHRQNVRAVLVLEMIGFACHTPGCQTYPQGLPIEPPSNRGDFLAVVGDSQHPSLLQAFQQIAGSDAFRGRHRGTAPTVVDSTSLPSVETLAVPMKGAFFPAALRSDHAPFWWHDIPAVMVTDTANFRNPHYHQPSDTVETIDQEFLTGAAQIVVNTATRLLENGEKKQGATREHRAQRVAPLLRNKNLSFQSF